MDNTSISRNPNGRSIYSQSRIISPIECTKPKKGLQSLFAAANEWIESNQKSQK
jgi:hypothetical protein